MALRAALWLYLALIVSLPLMRPFHWRVAGHVVPATDLLFVVTGSLWLLAWLSGQIPFRRSRFYLLLGAFLAALTLSAIFSETPARSAIKLAGVVYLVGLAVLTFNLVQTSRFLRQVMAYWLFGTTITIGAGVLAVALFYSGFRDWPATYLMSGYGSLPPGDYPRILALLANPNMLCNYLIVSFMIAAAMHAAGWLRRPAYLLLVLGIAVTAVFSISPGLGGLALCAGLWSSYRLRQSGRRRLAHLALTAGIVIAAVFLLVTTISPVTNGQPLAGPHLDEGWPFEPSSRVLAWQTAFQTFRQHPLSGIGLGMEVSEVHYLNASGYMEHLTDAHNVWLSLGAQAGLLGLLAFLAIVIYLMAGALGQRPSAGPAADIQVALSIALVGALLFQGLTGSFEDARHLWVLMGLIAAVNHGLE